MFKSNIFSITITNSETTALPWVAFGYNEGLTNVPGVSVSVPQTSLQQSTRQSASIPFLIKSIKIRTQSQAQLNNPIQIKTVDATGKLNSVALVPMNYYDVMTSIPYMVKVYDPQILIDSRVSLTGTINARETMYITVEISKKSGFSNFVNTAIQNIKGLKFKVSWRLLPI